jgi:hypothetical protein
MHCCSYFCCYWHPNQSQKALKTIVGENLLKDITHDGAVDCLLWLMNELKMAHAIFLACDKGNTLSWWDKTKQCIRSVFLDIDGNGGTSENVGD